ncbi:MAG: phospholipid carrier-dependent glycosyltransferase, partial [Burkholderiales bacterium]|nr:phospholipid carrier-dependent glycosyltransferase [Burkholderiales bacterium]
TSIIWLVLLFILLIPGGLSNIKKVTKIFNPDTSGLADLLLWQELPQLFSQNMMLQNSLTILPKCNATYKLIGTTRWYWTAQLEYQKVFAANYKILNLDLQSSNFYTWRDNLANFANCPVLVISDRNNLSELSRLINIHKSYKIQGIGDYKSINLMVVEGIFKNTDMITFLQQNSLKHPHY